MNRSPEGRDLAGIPLWVFIPSAVVVAFIVAVLCIQTNECKRWAVQTTKTHECKTYNYDPDGMPFGCLEEVETIEKRNVCQEWWK